MNGTFFLTYFCSHLLRTDYRTPETWGRGPQDPTTPGEQVPPEPEGPPPPVPGGWRQIPRWRNRRRNGRQSGPPPPSGPAPPQHPLPPPETPHAGGSQMPPQGPRVLRKQQYHVPHLTAGPDPPPQRSGSWSQQIWQRKLQDIFCRPFCSDVLFTARSSYVPSSASAEIEAEVASSMDRPASPGLFGPPSI